MEPHHQWFQDNVQGKAKWRQKMGHLLCNGILHQQSYWLWSRVCVLHVLQTTIQSDQYSILHPLHILQYSDVYFTGIIHLLKLQLLKYSLITEDSFFRLLLYLWWVDGWDGETQQLSSLLLLEQSLGPSSQPSLPRSMFSILLTSSGCCGTPSPPSPGVALASLWSQLKLVKLSLFLVSYKLYFHSSPNLFSHIFTKVHWKHFLEPTVFYVVVCTFWF